MTDANGLDIHRPTTETDFLALKPGQYAAVVATVGGL